VLNKTGGYIFIYVLGIMCHIKEKKTNVSK